MPKGKIKITQNQAIFGVLGLLAIGVIIMNVTGTTDKDIGLGGDDRV